MDIASLAQALANDSEFAQDFAAVRSLNREIVTALVRLHASRVLYGQSVGAERLTSELLTNSSLTWSNPVSDSFLSPAQPTAAQPANTPKEPPVFFTNQTLLNGSDISKLSDDAIYAAITAKKKQIDDWDKIDPKPQRLVKQIDGAKADLNKLIAYLDGQDAPKASAAAA